MSLPRKVQEAAAKAEALYQELYTPQQVTEPDQQLPVDPESQPSDTPPEDSQTVEAQSGEPQGINGSQDDPVSQDNGNWEHRYKVLSGKYSSEVPRLAAENRELKGSMKALEEKIDRLSQAKSTSKESLIRQEEVDEYGESLIDVIRRAAREEASSKDDVINDLKAKVDSFDSKVSRNVEVDFYEDLGRRVPEWVAINDDQNFHKWLEGYDDLTGQRRQELLSSAEAERDARRVSNFFLAYQKTSQSWAATANKKLESQVVPSSQNHTQSPPAKRIWTRGEVQDFYARVRTGDITGSQAVALESEIQVAAVEGRIR
jgi:hypothetical protein